MKLGSNEFELHSKFQWQNQKHGCIMQSVPNTYFACFQMRRRRLARLAPAAPAPATAAAAGSPGGPPGSAGETAADPSPPGAAPEVSQMSGEAHRLSGRRIL